MANRKSNKTEHVMRLITKDAGAAAEARVLEDRFEGGAQNEGVPGVTASVSSPEGELNYKAKLKIEIEPEIEIKEPERNLHAGFRPLPKNDGSEAGEQAAVRKMPAAGLWREGLSAPDGIPYENRNDDIVSAVFEAANKASVKMPETMEEVRASIKKDEEKRVKNIEFMEELFGFNCNLVNISELLTKELMPSIMEKMGVCKCGMCASNVMALTLNALPPKYVTTDVGKQYSQLEMYKSQYELDVIQALTKACLKVKAFPRHEIAEG